MEHYLIDKDYLINEGYIPWDKSWIIRMGMLDLLGSSHQYDDTIKFLEREEELGDDLKALHRSLIAWNSGDPVDVGESATLYRFLRFASWKLNLDKKFILRGSLKKRKICDNPEIINYPLKKLLTLDDETSQWASAAVLLGNDEKIDNPHYKLELTYDAVEHWKQQRDKGQRWEPRRDETILAQAVTYLKLLKHKKTHFTPEQAEDYCFARAFGFMTKEEGEQRWPSLRGHESKRIKEMERVLKLNDAGGEVDSLDHRVVQAIAMLQKVQNKPIKIKHLSAVNKSWPQFPRFLDDSPELVI